MMIYVSVTWENQLLAMLSIAWQNGVDPIVAISE